METAPEGVSQTRAAAFQVMWVTGRPVAVSALATILADRTSAQIQADLDWLARRGRARLGDASEVIGIAGIIDIHRWFPRGAVAT